jgi:DNA-binding response OmpR family regulator
MRRRILLVEDEAAVARGVRDALSFHGYAVEVAADGEAGLRRALSEPFDLLILDLMLPRVSGFDLLKQLREADVHLPVLILTARGQEGDRVRGLELGADDYVVKPFSVKELVARVDAHIRRRAADAGVFAPVRIGEAEFDFRKRAVTRDGRRLAALPKEIDLARFLLENRGRVVTRDELLRKVWEYPVSGLETRTVDNYVLKLRQKVEPDPARPRHILTVRGQGYLLAEE